MKTPLRSVGSAGAGLSLPAACCLPGSSCPEGVAPSIVEVVLGPDDALSMASSPLPAVAAAWLGCVSSDCPEDRAAQEREQDGANDSYDSLGSVATLFHCTHTQCTVTSTYGDLHLRLRFTA